MLNSRSKPYIIPEYSLTSDLLPFLICNLQYRYQNKGTLPPSMPKQLWFGEFIHGVMEESYLQWQINENKIKAINTEKVGKESEEGKERKQEKINSKDLKNIANQEADNIKKFPWNWLKDIRPIEELIDKRLRVKGLYPPSSLFCPYSQPNNDSRICEDNNHPHKKIASSRCENIINLWGPHLFPLIDEAEVMVKGMRVMPDIGYDLIGYDLRSDYYSVNGIIDVLSSINIKDHSNLDNLILNYLKNEDFFKEKIETIETEDFEIIIDYKGMKRPPVDSENWKHHKWQISTYAWLREMQEDSKPIIAGIIFYLNELVPSTEDIISIKEEVIMETTDIFPKDKDLEILLKWNEVDEYITFSEQLRMDRSIRIIEIDESYVSKALKEFDNVVSEIEKSIIMESNGNSLKDSWKATSKEKRTCDACDFKSFCPNKKIKTPMRVP